MQKTLKRIISVALVALMTATLITGCASPTKNDTASTNSTTGTESTDSKETNKELVNLVCVFPGQASTGQDAVIKAVNEKLIADGLNINVSVTYLDDYWNQLALGVAGGTTYDVAWAHASVLSDLVSKKVYQPVTDALVAVGAELVSNTPDFVLKGGQIDGVQYAFPRVIPMANFSNTIDIRGDLRKKYNVPEINSVETLEQYFTAIKTNEPNMEPYTGSNFMSLYPVYSDGFFPLGDGGKHPVVIDPKSGKASSFMESEGFAQICATMLKWQKNGWQMTRANDAVEPDAKFEQGLAASVPSNVMRASERADIMTKNLPEAEMETVLLTKDKKVYVAGDNMLAVPSSCKNVESSVAFINWIKKDQANYDLWSFGVEGVNYMKNGEAVDTAATDPSNVYTMNTWMWNDIRLARFSANYPQDSIDMLKNWDSDATVTPYVGFTMDTTKIASQVAQVNAVMDEYFKSLTLGTVDYNEIKADLSKQLKGAGIDDIVAEAQTQVDAFVAK